MKCQILFSGKNKKNIINLSSAENAQRVVKVKILCGMANCVDPDLKQSAPGLHMSFCQTLWCSKFRTFIVFGAKGTFFNKKYLVFFFFLHKIVSCNTD